MFIVHHVADAGLVRIQSGQQRRARRATAAHVVKLREAQSARGEFVEIRRGDFRAVTTEVGKAEVIGEDNYDVRPRLRLGLGGVLNAIRRSECAEDRKMERD